MGESESSVRGLERERLLGRQRRVEYERRELKLLARRRAGEAHVAEDVLRGARC